MVFGYFFKKTEQVPEKIQKIQKIYLVLDQNSGSPLGIFSSLEKAKTEGEKATYHNCRIIEYTLDGKCRYLVNSIYEN